MGYGKHIEAQKPIPKREGRAEKARRPKRDGNADLTPPYPRKTIKPGDMHTKSIHTHNKKSEDIDLKKDEKTKGEN